MRILVDASIVKPGLAGIRSYVLGVVGALARRSDIELSVATSVPEAFGRSGRLQTIPISPRTASFGPRALWRETCLAGLASRTSADLVFVPFPEHPLRRLGVPSVLVVFDVGPLVLPALFSRAKRARFSLDLGRACQAATKVVCVSNSALLALYGTVGVDPDRCEVIGAGIQPGALADTPGHHDGDPYALYVGTLLRHKNVTTLVRAFSEAPGAAPCKLVLVGPTTEAERRSLQRLLDQLRLGDRVQHRGWVSIEELARLYTHAQAVAVPSLHEGFGLPVLEAMQAGVPVVASDIPSIREVAGDAVLYVPQTLKPDSWRDALHRICNAPDERATLVRRGQERASTYSWDTVADQLMELFRSIATSG